MLARISMIALPMALMMVAPSALALSPSQCNVKSVELNKTGTELMKENAALKAEAEEIEAFGLVVDDAVSVQSWSADNRQKAETLKAEFAERQSAYNARLAALSEKGVAFNESRAEFQTSCAKYFKK